MEEDSDDDASSSITSTTTTKQFPLIELSCKHVRSCKVEESFASCFGKVFFASDCRTYCSVPDEILLLLQESESVGRNYFEHFFDTKSHSIFNNSWLLSKIIERDELQSRVVMSWILRKITFDEIDDSVLVIEEIKNIDEILSCCKSFCPTITNLYDLCEISLFVYQTTRYYLKDFYVEFYRWTMNGVHHYYAAMIVSKSLSNRTLTCIPNVWTTILWKSYPKSLFSFIPKRYHEHIQEYFQAAEIDFYSEKYRKFSPMPVEDEDDDE